MRSTYAQQHKEAMGENRQIRSRSWNRMPTKRCSANGIVEEFIVVDDDEVIILDFPESSKSKVSGTSRTGNKSILQRVISIDDDDDDDVGDETENVHNAGISSSSNPPATNLQTSAEVDNDDCQFIQEKCAAFRFSKCKQTFSTMPSSGFRFGLGSDTDSDFSDSDCSDCEILEGSRREVREQWEQAAFLRKMKRAGKAGLSEEAGPSNLHYGEKAGLSDETGPSNLHCDTGKHDQTSFFFAARNPDGGKVGPSEAGSSNLHFDTNFDGRIPDLASDFGSVEEDNRAKNHANSSFSNKEDFRGPFPLSPEIRVEHAKSDTPSSHFSSSKEPIDQTSFKKVVEQPNNVQVQCETSQTSDGDGDTTHAEEAQKLRKRRKLENTRQLEMERRQKERVEEVRETQKKDEESMNMREKVRAEINKSLKQLELGSFNMTSLLRGLGIHVGGGISPLPDEVHAAYKRAVLKFHPDRASRGDIKQQVEAEEKFKLIARMKDKFKS
ncbi:hypothetical protein CARUB_v10021556mg [Capsella rubella]|uniref:J domain-containing protein n=1 Tax=Capsella rubella TaxID=81985 RepID=R0GEK8_9BRAS|nr:hypothetical protein CARUB_v10021556mg [Capsella rubella]